MTAARPGWRDLRALVRLVRLDRPRFLLTTVLGVVTVLAGAALLALSGYLICRAAQQPPILTLGVLMVAVRAVALVRPGARYGERLAGHDLAFRSLGRLRTFVFARIEPLAPAELEQYRDGELLGRMVGDIDELQDLVLRILLPVAVGVPAAMLIVALTALWAPGPALVLGLGLLLGAVVPPLLSHDVTVRTQDHQTGLRAALTADLVDALQAAPELWLNGADDRVAAALADDDKALVDAARRDARIAGAADAGAVAITGLTALAVLVTATAAAGAGHLDPLLVAPVTLVALASFEAVDPLAVAARHLPSVLGAGARVLDLVERRPSVADPDAPHEPPARRPDAALQGVVVTRGRDRVRVLDGLDLRVRPGERVVVQGPSGSGKSTALLVLVRFLERDAGEATLDGVDLREYAQDDVRRAVLLLDQDPHVFNSDIRENVAFARPGSDDAAILDALDRARLGAWVTSLPEGLDTPVGEQGRALSGGQRQRLALARAFLADPSVLLLDEPTAHLDAPTADALLADLAAEAGSRSIVLVSHGHEGPFAADRTVVVAAGRAHPAITGGC